MQIMNAMEVVGMDSGQGNNAHTISKLKRWITRPIVVLLLMEPIANGLFTRCA